MDWQPNPYTVPAVAAAGLAAALGYLASRRRPAAGSTEFALFALAVAVWCLANGMEFARVDLEGKIWLTKVEYIGVVSAPPLWLACVAAYTRLGRRLSRRQLAVLGAIPFITLVLVWTNEQHHLIWTKVGLTTGDAGGAWTTTYGPWFWVHAAYSYLALAVAMLLIVRFLRRQASPFRGQPAALLIGMAAPWAANFLYISRLSPARDIDLTPFGFALGALAVSGGFWRFRLFDVIPIAREAPVQSLPDAVVVLDPRGRVVDANPAAERLLGRPLRSILGRPTSDLGEWAGWLSGAASTLEIGREPGPANAQTARSFDVRRVELTDRQGQPGGWLVLLRDISDRAQAEAGRLQLAREQAARAAAEMAAAERRASEERLRLALAAGGMGTWDWDLEADLVSWSPEVAVLMGLANVTEADSSRILSLIHPDDRRQLQIQLARAFRGESNELTLEFRPSHPAAAATWLGARGRVFRDTGGRAIRVIGVAMNTTERKEADARREALARADQLRALGQMAAGIAHDLNQSLALISGHAELAGQELTRQLLDAGRLRQLFEVIVGAAQEGGQSIRRLLAFVRAHETTALGVVDIADLLQGVARLTAPRWRDAAQAEGRPIDLVVESASGVYVAGDAAVLRDALTNVVFNAVDALPRGGSICLRGWRSDNCALVEVQDSGVGMSPQVRARVFEPFFTTKGERGTGLGLSQVRGAIQQHGGEVELESIPGAGTVVRFLFPLARDVPIAEPEVTKDDAESSTPTPFLRILVVDDEERIVRMMVRMLSSVGHSVATALSGEAALELLACRTYDLVITDLSMGAGMNGWELAERVRQQSLAAEVVLATGWGADIDPDTARNRGVVAVLAKPYRVAEIRRITADIARSIAHRVSELDQASPPGSLTDV